MVFIYKDRVKRCYSFEMEVSSVFDSMTADMMKNLDSANSVPPDFMLPSFLTACGHALGKYTVKPWGKWVHPSIFYSSTVGFTDLRRNALLLQALVYINFDIDNTDASSFRPIEITELY